MVWLWRCRADAGNLSIIAQPGDFNRPNRWVKGNQLLHRPDSPGSGKADASCAGSSCWSGVENRISSDLKGIFAKHLTDR
jgi:hypothetical protein